MCDFFFVFFFKQKTAYEMRISDWSSDVCSSDLGACGNGTRCVAALVMGELGRDAITIETAAGLLEAKAAGPARVTVDMGEARLGWTDIPLREDRDTLHLGIGNGPMQDPAGPRLGQPPAALFVDDQPAKRVSGQAWVRTG